MYKGILVVLIAFVLPASASALAYARFGDDSSVMPRSGQVQPNVSHNVNATVQETPATAASPTVQQPAEAENPAVAPVSNNSGVNWPLVIGIVSLVVLIAAGAASLWRRKKMQ